MLNGSTVCSPLDCSFWMSPYCSFTRSSKIKSAFVTPFVKFEINKVPFGLAKASHTFPAVNKHEVLKGLLLCF